MKNLFLITIAAVVLVGCGESQQTAKAPDISIHNAASGGDIELVLLVLDETLANYFSQNSDASSKSLRGVHKRVMSKIIESKKCR